MPTSSADHARLDAYVRASDDMNNRLAERWAMVGASADDLSCSIGWGTFDASPTLRSLKSFIEANRVSDAWVATVAEAFRQADVAGMPSLDDSVVHDFLVQSGVPTGPREAVTVDDPIMAGWPATSGYADDPVCTATGHFVETEHDIALPWRAGPLAWSRTYSSRWREVGAFGRGWVSWADVAARTVEGATVVVFPDGKRARFAAGERRVAGVPAELVVAGAGLALAFFNGDRWVFDATGLLVEVLASGRDRISFRRAQGGRLVELVHDKGRTVELSWAGDRVAAVVSSDGQRVSFTYDADGDLVGATGGPAGARSYVQAGGGLIASVVDADGVALLVNTYDGEGRVLTQRSPFGRVTCFSYRPGGVTVVDDDQGGPAATFVHDPAGRLVGVIDDHGARMVKRYDSWGNPVATTDRTGALVLQVFDDRGRLLHREEPDGAITTTEWDHLDRIVARIDPTGARVELAYEGTDRQPSRAVDALGAVTRCVVVDGDIVRVTDPDGVATVLDRDADGLVIGVSDAAGRTTRIERGGAGEPVGTVGPSGETTRMARDDAGRVIARHLPDGGVVGFEWTAAGRLAASVSPTGARSRFERGDHGEVVALADSTGAVTSYDWDHLGLVSRVTNPLGDKANYTHDALGRLTMVTDPAGGTWSREHDAEGRVTAVVDPNGARRECAYDQRGLLVAEVDPLGQRRTFAHDPAGRVVEVVAADGAVTRIAYDAVGRRTAVTDPTGGVTRYSWTSAGRLAEETSHLGHTTTYRYDATGEAVEVVDPTGAIRTIGRDASGRPNRITDPTGETVEVDHDPAGRVAAWRDAAGAEHRYNYDHAGRLLGSVGPDGAAAAYSYDPAGRLVEAVDALGAVTRMGYDALGNPAEVIDPLGGVQRFTHDPVGRLTSCTDANGATTGRGYDPAGHLRSQTDATGTVVVRRDAAGRVVGLEASDGTRARFTLDPAGRLVRAEKGGYASGFAYDAAGRMVTATTPAGALSYGYDADGRRILVEGPNGAVHSSYDPAGRLTTVTHPTGGETRIERDAAGRVTAVHAPGWNRRVRRERGRTVAHELRTADRARTATYTHDPAGRIATVTDDDGTRTYRRDAAGQLVAVTTPAGERSWTYDRAGRRTTDTGPSGERLFTYDPAGQLLEVVGPDGDVTTYAYDAAGRRTSRQRPNGDRTTWSWDGLGRLRMVAHGGADGDDEPGPTIEITTDAFGYPVDIGNAPLLWDRNEAVPTFERMADTDVAELLGAPGPVVVDGPTDPIVETSGAGEADNASAGVPFGLTADGEPLVDGLAWMGARLYDPETGSFLARDPLPAPFGAPTIANPYAFAYNDPTSFSDPLGLTPLTDAQLTEMRESKGRNLLEVAGDSAYDFTHDPVGWVKDHGDELATGGLIVAGGIMIATGFGAPIGVGLIAGGVLSTGAQVVTTGEVDARQVWTSSLAGGVGGGAGALAAKQTSSIAIQMAAGAGTDLVTSTGTQYVTTGHVDPTSLVIDTVIGAGAGGVGSLLPGRGGAAKAAPTTNIAPTVTEPIIRDAMADAPLQTQQSAVSLPKVQSAVDQLGAGNPAPPIKVDGLIIVDGNHRYIAGRIMDQPPAVQPWPGGNLRRIVPWGKQVIDPTDWGG